MTISSRDRKALHFTLLALALTTFVRTAWICDDAEITFRCVMNLLSGYGPNFNIDERVQPYTHPLWFLLLSGATFISCNIFVSALMLSILISIAVLWLILSRVASGFWPGVLAVLGLLLSKAFVDFSTSGLENPLSHLLVVSGLWLGFRAMASGDRNYSTRSLLLLSFTYLSRPDLVVMVFPFGAIVLWKCHRGFKDTAATIGWATAPIALWTAFSLTYYGTPFPNTAYAKLGTGISSSDYVRQGIVYLLQSIRFDPITLIYIAIGILLAMRGSFDTKAIAAGIAAYLIYIVSIGGDFMAGRFLTAPLVAAAVILARTEFDVVGSICIVAVFVTLGAISLPGAMLSGRAYVNRDMGWAGITDERGFLFQGSGLATIARDDFRQPAWNMGATTVRNSCGYLGAVGLNSGPGTHIIDSCGLSDPLLARLPAIYDPLWRQGHFYREIPSGYTESFLKDKNLILDPATRRFWDVIRIVTRAPLLSVERAKAILRLNLGLVELPDQQMYQRRTDPPVLVDLDNLSSRIVSSGTWDLPSNKIFDSVIVICLDKPTQLSSIDVALAPDGRYLVEYRTGKTYQRITEIDRAPSWPMVRHQYKLPTPTPLTDRIRISALEGDGLYSIGHLFLNR